MKSGPRTRKQSRRMYVPSATASTPRRNSGVGRSSVGGGGEEVGQIRLDNVLSAGEEGVGKRVRR